MQTLKLTKKYETYPEYKDSGVEWFGKVPKTWQVGPLRSVLVERIEKNKKLVSNNILSVMKDVGVIRYADKGDVGNKSSDRPENYKIVHAGDIVLNSMNLVIGSVGQSKELGVTSSVYIIYHPRNREIFADYYHYLFRNKSWQKTLGRLGKGIMELRESISSDLLKIEPVPIPPLNQQKAIVNFLDEKTSFIDQIIERKQTLIELLREKRSETVNNSVNNVRGGTEKLKYIATERKIKLDAAPADLRYIGLENIESFTGKIVDSKEKTEPESSVNIFHKGDVLFGKLRPYLTKVLSSDFDGVCSGEFLTLVPEKEKIVSKYLFYKLLSKDFIKSINDSTYGTKMPRANGQFIRNQIITYPSLSEQIGIVKLLDNTMEIFEKVIFDINKSIEYLQEFKSSLISNVVTGKIKI